MGRGKGQRKGGCNSPHLYPTPLFLAIFNSVRLDRASPEKDDTKAFLRCLSPVGFALEGHVEETALPPQSQRFGFG